MDKARRKRFERSKDIPAHRFQDGDLEIIRAVAEHRFLNTYQIQRLTGRGIRNLRRRLQYLYHSGYLGRPGGEQDSLWMSGPMVYGLGPKGAQLLRDDKVGFDRGKIDWQRRNSKVSPYFLAHTLMIADVRIALELACRASQDVKLVYWEQGQHLYDRVYLPDLGQEAPIAPDAFFTLEVAGEEVSFHHFMLEVDRGTQTHRRFLLKLQAYLQWRRQGGHERLLDITTFRVLTITNSAVRRDNLNALAKVVDERQRGLSLFLFAFDGDINVDTPDAILKPIWRCPADDEWHTLLE